MPDQAGAFFDELQAQGHSPVLRRESGTVRFDLTADGATETWFIEVDKGDVVVVRESDQTPTCTVTGDRKLFERFTRGEANAMAAMLRGEMIFDGDPGILLAFQRLLPGPRRPE